MFMVNNLHHPSNNHINKHFPLSINIINSSHHLPYYHKEEDKHSLIMDNQVNNHLHHNSNNPLRHLIHTGNKAVVVDPYWINPKEKKTYN
ncbi:hypothetical protein BDA99DRAFT_499783, partial [Phascolomyces articulosus]